MSKPAENLPEPAHMPQAAHIVLRDGLLAPGPRKIWSQYLPHNIYSNTQVLSYRAIARAIADAQYRKYGITESPNRYKDRVRRAILGQKITPETINLFAESFDFPPEITEKLRSFMVHSPAEQTQLNKQQNTCHLVTASFYDIAINEDGQASKLSATLTLRARENGCPGVHMIRRQDIAAITRAEGGSICWDNEQGAWMTTMDYPLSPFESLEVRYAYDFLRPRPGRELFFLDFDSHQTDTFIRVSFADPGRAPQRLKAQFSLFNRHKDDPEQDLTVEVHEGRSTLHLPVTAQGQLYFYPE